MSQLVSAFPTLAHSHAPALHAAQAATSTTTQFGLEQISIIIAAVSAIAAALTALWTYAGAALGHRPFVIGEEYRDWTELGIEPEVPSLWGRWVSAAE